jgi:carbamoyltransferase
MKILGLNINHPDSSACLIVNGEILFAVEEERYSRIKHHSGFPINAIKGCLLNGKLNINEVDCITLNTNFYSNIIEKIKFSIKNFNSIKKLKKLSLKKEIIEILKNNFNLNKNIKIEFIDHHDSHLYSSYFLSGFKDCIGLTIDGAGDFCSTVAYKVENNNFKILKKIFYPHSLGIFYQSMTQFLGFNDYGDEYKFMGLASFGKPVYLDKVYKIISRFDEKNFFKLNLDLFSFHKNNLNFNFENNYPLFPDLFNSNMEDVIGFKKRKKNENIQDYHQNLAASVQLVFEEIVLNMLRFINSVTPSENLCLSGGCALNSKMNGKIIENNIFKSFYIQPSAGDAGGALGSALSIQNKYGKINIDSFNNSYLGPSFTNNEIAKAIKKIEVDENFSVKFYENFDDVLKKTALLISKKKIIAWFQDKMEWGPRALGNRSILADPRDQEIQNIINIKTKKREEFRPFAPSVLEEMQDEYFYMHGTSSRFMLNVYKAKEKAKIKVPAVVHIDGTSRVQSVNDKMNKKFYDLIKEFYKITEIPILLNTSFNKNEPIVCSPDDAISCFKNTKLDVLVMQNFIIERATIDKN